MREKPILFSAPMVRAILDGRKTMARRALKPQPIEVLGSGRRVYADADWKKTWGDGYGDDEDLKHRVGDTLWVRETAWICPPGWTDTPVNPRGPNQQEVAYKADDIKGGTSEAARDYNLKLTPSIFMPRWASRITLEIAEVRVERLQEISEEDAKAEGCGPVENSLNPNEVGPARSIFEALWTSINGPSSWDANPWVAAYRFERLT